MISTTIMPKIFQRLPLVKAALRLKLFQGPVCSTTQTGIATKHVVHRMNPGTTAKQNQQSHQQFSFWYSMDFFGVLRLDECGSG
jgi:hypothetical protein